MSNELLATWGIIKVGKQDGVTISSDMQNNRYLVEMPNKYDLTHTFKKYERVEFKQNPEALDKANNVVYATKTVFDLGEADIKQFMADVTKTRQVNKEMMTEREMFTTAISFDHNPQEIVYTGIPLQAKRDEHHEIIKNEAGKAIQTPGYVKGEILAAGKYLIAMMSERNHTAEKGVVHLIETSKFLKLEDYKKPDRLLAVWDRLGIDPVADIDNLEVKRGIHKYISFNESGLVKAINHTYTKDVKQTNGAENAVIADKPIEAEKAAPEKSPVKPKPKTKQPEMVR